MDFTLGAYGYGYVFIKLLNFVGLTHTMNRTRVCVNHHQIVPPEFRIVRFQASHMIDEVSLI